MKPPETPLQIVKLCRICLPEDAQGPVIEWLRELHSSPIDDLATVRKHRAKIGSLIAFIGSAHPELLNWVKLMNGYLDSCSADIQGEARNESVDARVALRVEQEKAKLGVKFDTILGALRAFLQARLPESESRELEGIIDAALQIDTAIEEDQG